MKDEYYIIDHNGQFVCKIYKPLLSKYYHVQVTATGGYLQGNYTLAKALQVAEDYAVKASERRIKTAFRSSKRRLGLTKAVLS
jgi:hypothetical protein